MAINIFSILAILFKLGKIFIKAKTISTDN